MRKQHYMTGNERQQLEALHRAGLSVAQIARQLGFCRQTIYNELRRGACQCVRNVNGMQRDVVEYSADKAQQIYLYMQTGKGRQLKIGSDHAYAARLEELIIKAHYSPGAALAATRTEGFETAVCISTLYSYIDKRIFRRLRNRHLLLKGSRKTRAAKPERRVPHPQWPSIEDRPEAISRRMERGHWEMDLIVGKAGTRAVLLTLTERLTREEIILKLPDRRAETIRRAIDRLERRTPGFRDKFKSITTDNGSEFLQYDRLIQSVRGGKRFEVWYCHSYAAWEKGTVENHNRMIRRFFPKGTDFTRVTRRQVQRVQDWMNQYPRRVLNWQSPAQMAG